MKLNDNKIIYPIIGEEGSVLKEINGLAMHRKA